MHGLPGDLTVRIDHGMGEEMLVVAFREVEALQGSSGFMACIGGLQYGFAQLDEMTHLPDGGNLLIEGRCIGMRVQPFGPWLKLVMQYGERPLNAVLVERTATACSITDPRSAIS